MNAPTRSASPVKTRPVWSPVVSVCETVGQLVPRRRDVLVGQPGGLPRRGVDDEGEVGEVLGQAVQRVVDRVRTRSAPGRSRRRPRSGRRTGTSSPATAGSAPGWRRTRRAASRRRSAWVICWFRSWAGMTSTGVPVASVNRAADAWTAAVSASPDEPNSTVSPSPPPPPPVAPDVAGRLGAGAAERSVRSLGVRRRCRAGVVIVVVVTARGDERGRRRRGRRRSTPAASVRIGHEVPWRVPLLVVGQWFGSLLPRITSVGLRAGSARPRPRRSASWSTSRRTTCSPAGVEGLADARQRHGGEAGGG